MKQSKVFKIEVDSEFVKLSAGQVAKDLADVWAGTGSEFKVSEHICKDRYQEGYEDGQEDLIHESWEEKEAIQL